jgi:UDP-N-acetylglucosamine--N-acetylmuramyl-(pentapeptide) pyrophosphoryl-undecaprenol N-acetylglucosamine transferase
MHGAHYVLAGGGTGGHLFPGLAVAEALRRIEPDARITFLCTDRPLDQSLLEPTGFRRIVQPVRPIPSQVWNLPGFYLTWRRSVGLALELMRADPPTAVLGLGGYGAGPAIVAARRCHVRRAILNPDAVPGRANRYLGPRCNLVVLQFEAAQALFPSGTRCVAWGCPIRGSFRAVERAHAAGLFQLDAHRRTLLVTGASQGARTINQALQRAWPQFWKEHPDWQLLHLTGPPDEADTREAYRAAGVPAMVLAFTHQMPEALSAADLVVSRAGASTLAELCLLGRPSILLPYPYHRDQHQKRNGQVLAEAGAALLLDDARQADTNANRVLDALDNLANEAVRAGMASAALGLARPEAAMKVAGWMAGHTDIV